MSKRMAMMVVVLLMGASTPVTGQTCNVRLAWDVNSEADLSGYQLVWGTTQGVYTSSRVYPKDPVITTTTPPSRSIDAPFTGADCTTRLYIAVKAFNVAGMYSGPSNEVTVLLTPRPRRPIVRTQPVAN